MSAPVPHLSAVASRAISSAWRLPVSAGRRASQVVPWTCSSCLSKQRFQHIDPTRNAKRLFSVTTARRDDKEPSSTSTIAVNDSPHTPAATSTTLPSHSAKQRSAFSRRITDLTDSILARASIAGQHINTYTGTDYSGIEALRKEISEQETSVRARHTAVGEAKNRHAEARAKQAASQREIVGLLERKSSWSPTDLERYMSLVRSEHVDDQSVQKATEELAVAERELEGTRSLLEKLERKQYHEEQIWSDTIRRNSTWVTIGLMGVNIILLLAQISIFEPYRRRKIVKQIREALDERSSEVVVVDAIDQVKAAVKPVDMPSEQLEVSVQLVEPVIAEEALPDIGTPQAPKDSPRDYLQYSLDVFYNLFSEETVQLKQVDLTTIALGSAAAGVGLATTIALLILRTH